MESSSLLSELSQSLVDGDAERLRDLIRGALEHGLSPESILNEGMIAGMAVVGEKFREGEFFIPEVLFAAKAMKGGIEILEPLLKGKAPPKAKMILGAVKGDIHDIGKNLVGMMMQGTGFEVIDIGIDVLPENFVSAAEENGAQLVGMSALTTTTMLSMKTTIDAFINSGSRQKVKIMVGGAVVTAEYAQSIGADGYAPDAVSAVIKAKELLGLE